MYPCMHYVSSVLLLYKPNSSPFGPSGMHRTKFPKELWINTFDERILIYSIRRIFDCTTDLLFISLDSAALVKYKYKYKLVKQGDSRTVNLSSQSKWVFLWMSKALKFCHLLAQTDPDETCLWGWTNGPLWGDKKGKKFEEKNALSSDLKSFVLSRSKNSRGDFSQKIS